jgi:hypothetical protein
VVYENLLTRRTDFVLTSFFAVFAERIVLITCREVLRMTLGMATGIVDLGTHFITCHWQMTVFMCLGGACLGLPIGMVGSWLVLDKVVEAWEAQLGGPTIRLPAPLNDARRAQALIAYVIPLAFTSVGAATGYYLCVTG